MSNDQLCSGKENTTVAQEDCGTTPDLAALISQFGQPGFTKCIDDNKATLTFDDGPTDLTIELLEILDQKNVNATFFVVGAQILRWPSMFQEILDRGYQVYSHTFGHLSFENMTKDEIQESFWRNDIIIRQHLCQKNSRIFRTPYDYYSNFTLNVTSNYGMTMVMHNSNGMDWIHYNQTNSTFLVENTTKTYIDNLKPGGIIHLHHYWYNSSVQAVPYIIDYLRNNSYEIVTLEECLQQNFSSWIASGSDKCFDLNGHVIGGAVCVDDTDCSASFGGPPSGTLLVIDSDSIKAGEAPNSFSSNDVNEGIKGVGQRQQLQYFQNNIGNQIDLFTGQVGDEGWFGITEIPNSWNLAGPTSDGAKNFWQAGPGLGSGGSPEEYLDSIPNVVPLRCSGTRQLINQDVMAIVYDSDVSINYGPLEGNLQGSNLGTIAFRVIDAVCRTGSDLPRVTIEILDADLYDSPFIDNSFAIPTDSSTPSDTCCSGSSGEASPITGGTCNTTTNICECVNGYTCPNCQCEINYLKIGHICPNPFSGNDVTNDATIPEITLGGFLLLLFVFYVMA